MTIHCRNIFLVTSIASALSFVGCEKKPVVPSTDTATYGSATIRGSIKFSGKIPEMKVTPNRPCHAAAPTTVTDETVVVNLNGTLRNTFVYLEGVGRLSGGELTPALLDQVDCRYEPHVVGVAVGQRLRVRSSDPCIHNVHYVPEKNTAENLVMSKAGDESTVKFVEAEFITTRCDIHPWMRAWIGVFENPFFATTGDDGTFTINRVPAGTYKLVAWHELYGKLEQSVVVSAGTTIDAEFVVAAP